MVNALRSRNMVIGRFIILTVPYVKTLPCFFASYIDGNFLIVRSISYSLTVQLLLVTQFRNSLSQSVIV